MDVTTLKAKMKSKQLPSYLIFSGDEWKVQEIYLQQISKITGRENIRLDTFYDAYRRVQSKSFLKKSVNYIVRDDKDLMQNEKLQEQIENGLLNDNMLIHIITSVDKRTKFYKRNKASIVDFKRLSDAMLCKYTLKEIKLSERNLMRLIDICEHDYGRILLEIDKIKRYKEYLNDDAYEHDVDNSMPAIYSDSVFEQLLKDGTIYEPPYDAIFDLVDAILDRNVNKTFDLLQQSYDFGEATMIMLSVLYKNAKALLQVQSYDGNNLSKATGLTGFEIKLAKKHVGKYSEKELIYIVRLIHKVTNGIKTGRMEDAFAMQYLLTHIM